MANPTGHRKLLEQLHADGIRYLFGNPGSSEEGLLDEITRFPEIQYIHGLQEAAIVGVADGYAQATQRPAVVQLHSGVGLGNGTSGLYHALRKQTPMLVLAGEAGVSVDAMEAHMAVDLVGLARPVTKYATRAIHPGSLLRLVRRCLKVAATPPWGPVFLAIPQDILDQPNDEPVIPTLVPETRVVPEPALIARCAELVQGATNPVILMGDGVAHSQAHGELAQLAEVLGARVYGLMASEINIPWTHPLYCGLTGHMFGEGSQARVQDADVAIICGTYVFPEVFPLLESPFRSDARIIHIDLDAYAIAKNHPVTLGLVSDPKLTLRALADSLTDHMTAEQKAAAAARAATIGAENARSRADTLEQDRSRRTKVPLYMSAFAEELAQQLPKDAILFDESLTHLPELNRWLPPATPGTFFQTPGGTLGVGIPGAVGAKLAHPERTVVGFTGDGGAMYTLQALWTAARYRVGAKFVVCNNHSYRLLKQNLVDYWSDLGIDSAAFPPAFDIGTPDLDFVALAEGHGVPGQRVARPEQIAPAIKAMLTHEGPYLIELVLEGNVQRPDDPVRGACTGEVPCS
ncbi:thiamine pyrophosphate-binding protein [Candidatus Thiosymbion oneisti]|uniref:thiamine pyrophosphate-binding protein n=1 Tax=Candidatus Thiosymbion oneisti TaxID=589554 RepID=UPI000A490263|nr:thiamine pyrophosphate-binding protein [Candidatus Thiosymbion oneisti]